MVLSIGALKNIKKVLTKQKNDDILLLVLEREGQELKSE
ncbi:hypothetical protein Q604_UNBC04483G0002 [human gut metagenome]|uniref:Uncharacterized protein n=1 Tax=human gut metagenome TaxID=408170 RepID=W1YGG6_9ZZZZ